jgi:hypothetical protein
MESKYASHKNGTFGTFPPFHAHAAMCVQARLGVAALRVRAPAHALGSLLTHARTCPPTPGVFACVAHARLSMRSPPAQERGGRFQRFRSYMKHS